MSYPVATLAGPNYLYIIMYTVTARGQIVYSRMSHTDPEKHVRYIEAQQTSLQGPVKVPASISAVYANALPSAYGVITLTKGGNDPTKEYVIAQISPIVQFIGKKDKLKEFTLPADTTAVKALTNPDDKIWIYYFHRPYPDRPLELKEAYGNAGGILNFKGYTGVQAPNESRLTAVALNSGPDGSVKTDRLVFYQEERKGKPEIHCLLITHAGEEREFPIGGTDNAKSKTPMAAVVTGRDDKRVISLYWLSERDLIYRSTSRGLDQSKWENVHKVEAAHEEGHEPLSDTELSVTAIDGKNYVFFIKSNQEGGATNYDYVVDVVG